MSTSKKTIASEVLDTPVLEPVFINTWLNFEPSAADVYEYVSPISETVPEMTIDLRLMLERSASGIPVPMRNDGYSDEEYPDIWKMDEFELASFREELAERMNQMKDELHVSSKRLEELEDEQREKRKNAVTEQQQNGVKQDTKKAD